MKIFAIFHLNLMFSSIPEEDRQKVIKRCYWPLLRLIEKHGFPLGIEASGITLEIIRDLDPEWIDHFRTLLGENRTEFIGCGYGQVIGPLVPSSVNKANLQIGMEVCREILRVTPSIALVNEQAWSAGLVQHYLDAGFKGVFMDYDNPARFAQWDESIPHYPQRALGVGEESIPILWSRSMVFQKLQRLAHDEIELAEYLDYVENLGTGDGWLPIYGNDAEIFDFRPGRYKTEAVFGKKSEWDFILNAFSTLQNRGHEFHLPGAVLKGIDHPLAGKHVSLCCAEQPVPVKKQQKYNITRWAVSGRDDFRMNSMCRAVAEQLEKTDLDLHAAKSAWKELCFCWSSDFRTHITTERFNEGRNRLQRLAEKAGCIPASIQFKVDGSEADHQGRLLEVETQKTSVTLNTAKGLAIHRASFHSHNHCEMFGTLEHGYFTDIGLGADFFSGHVVMEGPGSPKETDLCRVFPVVMETEDFIQISCGMEIHQGHLDKAVRIHKDNEQIDILYRFNLRENPQGYIRMGHVTLLSGNLNKDQLFYSVANGGKREFFSMKDKSFDHSNNVSFLVSSSHATGLTDSKLIFGGEKAALVIEPIVKEHAFIAMISCIQADPSPFVRVSFSMQEMDETCRHSACGNGLFNFSTGFSIKPYLKAGSA